MKYKVAVKGIIRRAGGEILIVKRSGKDNYESGVWETVGGGIDDDDSAQTALLREIKEEVNLDVKVGDPFNIFSFTNDEGEKKIGITFICEYIAGELKLSSEHTEYAWINPFDFKTYKSNESLQKEIASYASTFGSGHEKFSISQKVILIREGKCLIAEINGRPGVWDIPGGRIDLGENKEAALRREVKEELNINNFEILDFISYDTWPTRHNFSACGTAVLISSNEAIELSDEHLSYNWISEEEIDNYTYIWPAMSSMIKKGFLLNKKQF